MMAELALGVDVPLGKLEDDLRDVEDEIGLTITKTGEFEDPLEAKSCDTYWRTK